MKVLFFRDLEFHRVQGKEKPLLHYSAHRDKAQPPHLPFPRNCSPVAEWILAWSPATGPGLLPAAGSRMRLQ